MLMESITLRVLHGAEEAIRSEQAIEAFLVNPLNE
jgi:hypothetical protein